MQFTEKKIDGKYIYEGKMKKGIKNGTVKIHSSVFYIRIFLIKKKIEQLHPGTTLSTSFCSLR